MKNENPRSECIIDGTMVITDGAEQLPNKLDRWNCMSEKLGINPITYALADMDVLCNLDESRKFDAEHLFFECLFEELCTFREQVQKRTARFMKEARCMS